MGGAASKTTSNRAAAQRAAKPKEKVSQMDCTVYNVMTNESVPFSSSVKKEEESLRAELSSDEEEGDDTVPFGDFPIPKDELDGNGQTPPTAYLSASSAQGSQPRKKAKKVKAAGQKPTASETFNMGDMAIPLKGFFCNTERSCLASANLLFPSRIRFAFPVNYSMQVCGGFAGAIRSISASADGQQMAVAVMGQKVCYYVDTSSKAVLMSIKGHLDPILSCAHSRDNKFLVTASMDCTVVLWDLNNAKKLRSIPVASQSNTCYVSDESDVIVTTSTEDFVYLWEAKTCDQLISFQRHTSPILSVALARRGGLVASGATNGEVYVWNQSNGESRFLFARHRTPVLAVAFSFDGQRLCSVDRELLVVWDLFTGHPVFGRDSKGNTFQGPDQVFSGTPIAHNEHEKFTTATFLAGNLIAVGTIAKIVMILDPNSGSEILSLPLRSLVTCMSTTFAGDVLFLGDYVGNLHKLTLNFSSRDVVDFNMNCKPSSKEKVRME